MVAGRVVLAAVAAAAGGAGGVDQVFEALDAWQLDLASHRAQALAEGADPQHRRPLVDAEILFQQGQHQRAWAIASDLAPASARDRDRLADWKPRLRAAAALAEGSELLTSAHFALRFQAADRVLAELAVGVLEAALGCLGAALGPHQGDIPIAVEILPDVAALAAVTGLTVAEVTTTGTIAVCKDRRLMMVSPRATRHGFPWADTLAHELAHLLISERSQNRTPVWLHEGIAKYYESCWRGPPGQSLPPASARLAAEASAQDRLVPLARMHPSMAKLSGPMEAALAFAEVFVWVETVCEAHGPRAFAPLLAALAAGVDLLDAWPRATGRSQAQWHAAWRRRLASRPMPLFPAGAAPAPLPVRFADAPDDHQDLALLPPAARAATRLGSLLEGQHHLEAAAVEYRRALDAGGAGASEVVTPLARVLAALGQGASARALLDELLRWQPFDAEAHLWAARLAMAADDGEAAYPHALAVRWLNPFQGEAHHRVAALLAARVDPDANAIALARHLAALADAQSPRP